MKDIGTIFKEKREEIGIKEDEAAKDLNITIPQLENLEDGNINAFKDIFFLKDLVKKYEAIFYSNIDKALDRLRLIDIAKTKTFFSIDYLIKYDIWEDATLKKSTEVQQEEFEVYISHIAELHRLFNENGRIVNEMDKLLIELTSLNDSNKDNDLNELKDYIQTLQSLNSQMCEDEELEKIMMKY